MVNDHERRGRIRLTEEDIATIMPVDWQRMMGSLIIVDVVSDTIMCVITYTAHCQQFDELPEGASAPRYEWHEGGWTRVDK